MEECDHSQTCDSCAHYGEKAMEDLRHERQRRWELEQQVGVLNANNFAKIIASRIEEVVNANARADREIIEAGFAKASLKQAEAEVKHLKDQIESHARECKTDEASFKRVTAERDDLRARLDKMR